MPARHRKQKRQPPDGGCLFLYKFCRHGVCVFVNDKGKSAISHVYIELHLAGRILAQLLISGRCFASQTG